jgi:ribose transport system permease protein
MLSVTARLGLANWRQNIIHIGFVVIFLVFAVALHDRRFLNPTNLLNIFRQTAMIAVMAIVMTYVLSAGEIDLPVGAVTGLASVVTAMAIGLGGLLLGVGAGLATGIAVATFNGLLTTRVGIPSFLTTLAMMGIAKGVAMWISDTVAVPIISHACLAVRRRQHRPGPRPLGLDAGAGAKKLVV